MRLEQGGAELPSPEPGHRRSREAGENERMAAMARAQGNGSGCLYWRGSKLPAVPDDSAITSQTNARLRA